VDVLLGYEVKDNRLETTVKRLQEYRRSKDWDGPGPRAVECGLLHIFRQQSRIRVKQQAVASFLCTQKPGALRLRALFRQLCSYAFKL
ncbi:MAG: hypothetical protein II700_09105, partial [Firmicutes bacterium]|nr:hypothetical protein [Bacillota bacterium]